MHLTRYQYPFGDWMLPLQQHSNRVITYFWFDSFRHWPVDLVIYLCHLLYLCLFLPPSLCTLRLSILVVDKLAREEEERITPSPTSPPKNDPPLPSPHSPPPPHPPIPRSPKRPTTTKTTTKTSPRHRTSRPSREKKFGKNYFPAAAFIVVIIYIIISTTATILPHNSHSGKSTRLWRMYDNRVCDDFDAECGLWRRWRWRKVWVVGDFDVVSSGFWNLSCKFFFLSVWIFFLFLVLV